MSEFTWHAMCVLSIHLLINHEHFHLTCNLNPTYNSLATYTHLHSMKIHINVPRKKIAWIKKIAKAQITKSCNKLYYNI